MYAKLTRINSIVKTAEKKEKSLGQTPWISQVRELGGLYEEAATQIGAVEADKDSDLGKEDLKRLYEINRDLLTLADGTKNGADCRAAQVQVQ